MKFQNLYNLLLENSEKFSQYETWDEYLDDEDSLNLSEIPEFEAKFNLSVTGYFEDFYLNIRDNKTSYWLEKDDDDYYVIEKSDSDMENHCLGIPERTKLELLNLTEDDLYLSGWDSTIGDAKENPGKVYHYTTEDKWRAIQESGELNPSWGTGLTNRNTSGIFTSVSPETFADGSYGDVMLIIDLQSYKEKFNIPKLDLEPEPDILEDAINSAFFHKLDFHYDSDYSSDMSPETMIVGHSIPVEFVTVE